MMIEVGSVRMLSRLLATFCSDEHEFSYDALEYIFDYYNDVEEGRVLCISDVPAEWTEYDCDDYKTFVRDFEHVLSFEEWAEEEEVEPDEDNFFDYVKTLGVRLSYDHTIVMLRNGNILLLND